MSASNELGIDDKSLDDWFSTSSERLGPNEVSPGLFELFSGLCGAGDIALAMNFIVFLTPSGRRGSKEREVARGERNQVGVAG